MTLAYRARGLGSVWHLLSVFWLVRAVERSFSTGHVVQLLAQVLLAVGGYILARWALRAWRRRAARAGRT